MRKGSYSYGLEGLLTDRLTRGSCAAPGTRCFASPGGRVADFITIDTGVHCEMSNCRSTICGYKTLGRFGGISTIHWNIETPYPLGNFACFCRLLIYFKINFFETNPSKQPTFWNSLDLDRVKRFVVPDLGPNCLKKLHFTYLVFCMLFCRLMIFSKLNFQKHISGIQSTKSLFPSSNNCRLACLRVWK